jgi:hypothetical protein
MQNLTRSSNLLCRTKKVRNRSFVTGETVLSLLPAFRHLRIEPLPYSTAHAMAGAYEGAVQWRSLFTNI